MKAREEKDQLRQERAALWSERRAKQKELRQLEYKMRIVKMVNTASILCCELCHIVSL